jgi:DNA-binding NarL/FixJ family response regulator
MQQETFMSSRQPQSGDGANGSMLMDGVPSSLATQRPSPGAIPIVAKGEGQEASSIVFLDELRLTRDCITEAIQELCPDMNIAAMAPDDYQPRAPCAQATLIIYNLHRASIGEAAQRLLLDAASPAPPLLFITTREERAETMAAVEHGAMGLVRADARLELLIAAIRLVMAGGRYYPAETLTSLAALAPAPTDLA